MIFLVTLAGNSSSQTSGILDLLILRIVEWY